MYKTHAPLALILLALAYGASERQDPPPPPAGPAGTVLIEFGPAEKDAVEVAIDHRKGMTALDALMQVAEVEFTQADPTHPKAIDAINGVRTDLENSRFWMLDINGKHAMKMPQDIPLLAGFEVKFTYM